MPELIWDAKYQDGKKASPVYRSVSRLSTRRYYESSMLLSDFVAVDSAGVHWLLETKGQESAEVAFKDRVADQWCENATALTGTAWRYRKVPQNDFQALQPSSLADLEALG